MAVWMLMLSNESCDPARKCFSQRSGCWIAWEFATRTHLVAASPLQLEAPPPLVEDCWSKKREQLRKIQQVGRTLFLMEVVATAKLSKQVDPVPAPAKDLPL
mmetsp:Transcript_101395/g.180267  ORF Transcript_101395/g.180267 Transcript_101395/m.180267 type:complete len:102 (+) Transcript_101395:246-551(+)